MIFFPTVMSDSSNKIYIETLLKIDIYHADIQKYIPWNEQTVPFYGKFYRNHFLPLYSHWFVLIGR
jgi:hypothetical protein